MNRRQKIIVSVTGIFLVLFILVGLTYAYFLTQIQGNENDTSVSLITEDLKLEYIEGNGTITANNIQPGDSLEEKKFSVKNTGNASTEYAIIFDNVDNEFFAEEDLEWELQKLNDSTNSYEKVSAGFVRNMYSNNYQKQVLYINENIKAGATDEYKLIVTYVESGIDQSDDMAKTFSLRVNVVDSQEVNKKQSAAELAYQNYILENRGNEIDETAHLNSIKTNLSNKGYTTDEIVIYDDNVITGNVAKAFTSSTNPMQIGDKINYTSSTVPSDYNWYVLGIGEDGNLLITHDIPNYYNANSYNLVYRLAGADAYDTGKTLLNEQAQAFLDGNLAVSARSITIEDIDRITGYNPYNIGVESKYEIGTIFDAGKIREYNNTITYKLTSDGLVATGTNGVTEIAEGKTIFKPYQYEKYGNELVIDDASSNFTITTDYYSYFIETLTSNQHVDGEAYTGLNPSSKEYQMLFGNIHNPGTGGDSFGFWIATPYISAKAAEVQWGIRAYSFDVARLTGMHYWSSTNWSSADNCNISNMWTMGARGYIKAVVSIANNENITFECEKDSEGNCTIDNYGRKTFNINQNI